MLSHVEVEFEWDPEKARSNMQKHGVSFITAGRIFRHERVEEEDTREDYGEVRWIALGRVDADIFRVVYTWRGPNLVRIINAKKAGQDERATYFREIHPQST